MFSQCFQSRHARTQTKNGTYPIPVRAARARVAAAQGGAGPAREAKRTGLKATLQRRLHGLLVQAAIEARDEEESDSDGDGGAAGAASPPAPRGPARRVRARRS